VNNIVLYKSKYGNTLQYATWIAEELGWELRDFSHLKKSEIRNYQHVIFGSGVYMGRMSQFSKVLRWFQQQPIIIFACAGNLNNTEEIERIKMRNLTSAQLSFHQFFYLPGGVDFSKMKGFMKKMVDFYGRRIEAKKNRTDDENAILENMKHPTHYVNKKFIDALFCMQKVFLIPQLVNLHLVDPRQHSIDNQNYF
jgi:menaquinone-dependent protoporphyrinogen IX oxidase